MIKTFSEFEDENPREPGEPHNDYEYRIRREYREYALQEVRQLDKDNHTDIYEYIFEILSTVLH